MSKKVIIVGAGIVGLNAAYFLQKEGCEVTIIDKSNITSGASFVNAGYISPSHIIALSSPGIITKGIKWMFDSASPFYVKPRLEADFLKWALAFKKSATKKQVEKSIPVLKNFNVFSKELYQEYKNSGNFNFQYDKKGLLMCYKTEKAGAKEWEVGQRAIKEGLEVENLSKKEVAQLEPMLNVEGAILYKGDVQTTPFEFMNEMVAYLKSKNVTFLTDEEVIAVEKSTNKITKLITNKNSFTADEFVFAAGSWTPILAKKVGIKLLLQAGKGYRINVERPTGIKVPAILLEKKVAISPMHGFTRFGGTMEIGGINNTINSVRVNAIANAAEAYYNNLKITKNERDNAACGLRPVTPDGLPYIGKTSNIKNVTIAAGHAMLGWTSGPATGKLVSEIIMDKKTSLAITPFNVERKF